MPLNQQHAMADLAAADAIDREVTEESVSAKVGKSLADFRGIEALRDFYRRGGQQSRRKRLRGRIVAYDIRRVRTHAAKKLARRRSQLRPELNLIFPLTRADKSLGLFTQIGTKP